TYTAPIRHDIKGTVIYGDHVTLDTGTGAVHTAPGHGQDDYLVALEFDIPLLMPVDDNGVFTDEAGQFAGLSTDEANPVIIDWLREQGTLVAEKKINHSYPHCWRCHEPVIFRATDQWFVSMDKNSLREDALRAINTEVTWVPAWAKNRIGSMVADRPDWCISRQRSWGVPIPVFKCAKCGSTVATEETFDAVIELFNTKGADAWFTEAPSEYLPRGTKCEVCGCTDLVPEKDILDVWWESGVSHTSVCRHRSEEDGLRFPAEMYLEGSDQHRGWFQSSLLTSIGAYGVPPYKSVMHCGFTVDEEGRKMSKSLGNGIDPVEMCDKFGADVLRLWVSSCDYSQDVSISEGILKQVSDAYRRFRNTFRFLLGNLNDFGPENVVASWDELEPLDQWALVRLTEVLAEVEAGYENYRYNGVYRTLYEYVNELSSVYMDVTKDRLYAEAPNSPRRRAVQTVLMNILEVLVRVMSPILSFTTDEVWECYPPAFRNLPGREESVQLAGWPALRYFAPALPADAGAQVAAFGEMMAVREVVTKALEDARNDKIIGKSQEAALVVTAPAGVVATASAFDPAVFEELFIVASVTFQEGPDEEVTVEVSVAEGEKCPRCWNIRTLGGNEHHPDVCERCGNALDALGFEAE
ncbi:MAG: class I tRNA ligase family protein, partial [Adlercreutzia sp.]|nr:class I tRNA ligase family protein [Adlercreutzia sp.]